MSTCPPAPFPKTTFWGTTLTLSIVLLILWDIREDLVRLDSYLESLKNYLVQPNFSLPVLNEVFFAFVETLEMAFLGTFLGALIALPLSLLASDMGAGPKFAGVVRSILAFIRSIPLIFYGYMLVSVFGLGTVPGVLAMMIYTLGILSKQFFDEIANLDDTVAHALMTTGAKRFHIFWYGLLPEILPNMIAFTLLRFEINIREAAILGVVGAGGFGVLLRQYGALPPYDKLWTLILFVFVVVIGIEFLCRKTIQLMK